ncbi:MAG TPA: cell division protein FtsA, partial [Desulfobacteria bacterium]|nr:cell division protein FtsA [Desulfobacteria bacterium]
MSSNYIFSLDIGTRSVVGVVLAEGPRGLEIIACDQLEHQTRAMIDGQIHDIEQVSKALTYVKDKLEAKIGHPLCRVSVAAAGRALRTVRVKVKSDIAESQEVQKDDVLRLEMQAVQKAQKVLADLKEEEDEQGLQNYHCVGYSIVQYELDDHKIGNLYSQRGKTMSVEVIATFLPRVVVDSMSAALT